MADISSCCDTLNQSHMPCSPRTVAPGQAAHDAIELCTLLLALALALAPWPQSLAHLQSLTQAWDPLKD